MSLIIVEVFPEDQGQYICVAENPAGQATTSAYLTIVESAETVMELQPQDSTDVPAEEGVITLEQPMETDQPQVDILSLSLFNISRCSPFNLEDI